MACKDLRTKFWEAHRCRGVKPEPSLLSIEALIVLLPTTSPFNCTGKFNERSSLDHQKHLSAIRSFDSRAHPALDRTQEVDMTSLLQLHPYSSASPEDRIIIRLHHQDTASLKKCITKKLHHQEIASLGNASLKNSITTKVHHCKSTSMRNWIAANVHHHETSAESCITKKLHRHETASAPKISRGSCIIMRLHQHKITSPWIVSPGN